MSIKPHIRYVDIILPPSPTHISGTIERRWMTKEELMAQYGQIEEYELYINLLERISYGPEGLRENSHFIEAYNKTLRELISENKGIIQMTPITKQKIYCPKCGAKLTLLSSGKIPYHVNVNGKFNRDVGYPVCDAVGQKLGERH